MVLAGCEPTSNVFYNAPNAPNLSYLMAVGCGTTGNNLDIELDEATFSTQISITAFNIFGSYTLVSASGNQADFMVADSALNGEQNVITYFTDSLLNDKPSQDKTLSA